jgi:hypothetical protein
VTHVTLPVCIQKKFNVLFEKIASNTSLMYVRISYVTYKMFISMIFFWIFLEISFFKHFIKNLKSIYDIIFLDIQYLATSFVMAEI